MTPIAHHLSCREYFLLGSCVCIRLECPARQVAPMLSIGRARPLLGICIGERALRVAQVTLGGSAGPVARTAEFPYPPGVGLAQPDELGKALAYFLQWHGFTSRRAILGVPAKWLITRSHRMPPADAKTAADVLWLRASEEIPQELGPMVFDFAGEPSVAAPTNLLLAGLQKQRLDRLLIFAAAAELKVMSVTPTAVALPPPPAPPP